jgi:hypothetical protein
MFICYNSIQHNGDVSLERRVGWHRLRIVCTIMAGLNIDGIGRWFYANVESNLVAIKKISLFCFVLENGMKTTY